MAARDVLTIVVVLFAFALGFVFFNYLGHQLNTQIKTVPEINASANAVSAINSIDAAQNKMDYIYFAIFIGLTLGLIVSGWFVSGEGIYMWIYFFILIFIVIVAAIVSAVFNSFSTSAIVQATLVNFPIMTFIMSNLPTITAIIGLLGLMIMFGKPYLKGL